MMRQGFTMTVLRRYWAWLQRREFERKVKQARELGEHPAPGVWVNVGSRRW